MTIFAVLLPSDQPRIAAKIAEQFPDNFLRITDTQYLISAPDTVTEISNKLGITSNKVPPDPQTGIGIIFATSSYFGRASSVVWDWMKTKLEKTNG
jgi:hypothetical protein